VEPARTASPVSEETTIPQEHFPPTPAELASVELHPATVQKVQESPEELARIARGQLAIVQDRMVRKVLANPDATIGQYVTVHERLAKVARIEGNQQAPASGGQQVVINIIRAAGRERVTIEGEAKRVEEPQP
jgi:hypothetical protein